MEWMNELLTGQGVGHSILLLSVTIALGIQAGKMKIFGVSPGITFILFTGILFGHFGFRINGEILHFFKEFGLILFVFSVGMQVGPGFFSSFKKGGVTLNLLACSVVVMGAATALGIHYATGTPMATMVGILSGAVTNTPGLGAAQQAYSDLFGKPDETIALGYAVAYPLGVVGIILSILFVRYVFRVNFRTETERVAEEESRRVHGATTVSLVVKNPALFGKSIVRLSALLSPREFVISRIMRSDTHRVELVSADTVLCENDRIFVITTDSDTEAIKTFTGEQIDMRPEQWVHSESNLVSRRIVVTKSELNGKCLGDLQLRNAYGVNITRVHRSGVDLVATRGLNLQIGDKLTVVGSESAVGKTADILGNSVMRLNEPHLITIFTGIALGILLGSIPFAFPGIPQPVKLGLAGGPLIVAILLSRFGYKYRLITYTTQSANFMLREVGISLFLACVGLGAGEGFADTIINRGGFAWIGYGFLITALPLLVAGCVGRYFFKLNYFTLMGLLAGSTTDPPALAYCNATAGNDMPAVAYATVYPVTMFLRVLTAQVLILVFYA
ncbi:putative transporter [Bacteroidales bacterium Barb7]|nr:putative transporter [Bacteroidales bacterium Barb7]